MSNNRAIGMRWNELEKEIYTPEEIAESDLRVTLIGEFINVDALSETCSGNTPQ